MKIEELLSDLLLDSDSRSYQERFLNFLVMETFIERLRARGMSNADIYTVCLELDDDDEA